MIARKISELTAHKFTGQDIDNIYFVDDKPTQLARCSLKDIFNWIRETATKEGLTIELKDNKIIFIKNALEVGQFKISKHPPIPRTKHINNLWIENKHQEGMSVDLDELWREKY